MNISIIVPIKFQIDQLSILFSGFVTFIWLAVGIISIGCFKKDEKKKRFYCFYCLVYVMLIGISFSANIITFYLFYELMTLLSMPLIMHAQTKEAIMAGLKYLFYSLAGAYMILFGIYVLYQYGYTLTFTEGGILNIDKIAGKEGMLLIAAFLMILGFCVKAGMFPFHGWVTSAYVEAPSTASAVLSGVLAKVGIFGIVRVIYHLIGADFIRGTWVQTIWLTMILITILMGSMLAYKEKQLKKRIAYSSISQLSYILFGLAILNPQALTGSLLHMIVHGISKTILFLCCGAIIYKTGKTEVDTLSGIGKQMPWTMIFFSMASLSLIGIPPTGGFFSKWFLAVGSLKENIAIFSWLGVIILLISGLLTAAYLLPIIIRGFLPGKEE